MTREEIVLLVAAAGAAIAAVIYWRRSAPTMPRPSVPPATAAIILDSALGTRKPLTEADQAAAWSAFYNSTSHR